MNDVTGKNTDTWNTNCVLRTGVCHVALCTS